MKRSCLGSLLVTKAGFTVTTLRQNDNSPVEKSHDTKAKKARRVKINLKSRIITFFDFKGIVHKEFIPRGQTVNSGFYCEVLRILPEKVRRHRPQLWREQTWLLNHDNAPAHAAVLTKHFLAANKIHVPHTYRTPLI